MDAADVFRQGLGSVIPRPPQPFFHQPTSFPPQPRRKPQVPHRDDTSEGDGSSHRIAHTLTACCRCRQRKTRCDPTLPKCLPCERSGSVCEYFDTTKNKKISRNYVVRLQEKVRQLEAELSQYTDEDNEYPKNVEDMVRPGGLVKLNESDEIPRYLGPSSGIAMTRLVMDHAKRYTDSKRISDLIPDVRARRLDMMNRMQSIVSLGGSISGPAGLPGRKKSFPMISAHPAAALPTRQVTNKLIEVFNARAQYFTPILHEKVFEKDVSDVYDGDTDAYKNFALRMVLAISLQKLDTQYAGLADSYYLAAMQYFQDVVRPKDLKTLQCLVLIGAYSLLTPTRVAAYHIVGLATRICQQLGLADEKTISAGYSMGLIDALQLDMRRRMSWIVAGNELGLSYAMGRPNGFAKSDDFMDVKFFEAVDDENITEQGILPGPPAEKKLVAIHFCKMRIRQAEIRRALYEKKRPEPRDENDPVFLDVERKIKQWLDASPQEPAWCKPWFTGRYHTMVISLHRPSPQIPRPSSRSALKCYDSAVYIINLSNQQVKKAAIDITWVFLLTLNMSLNVLLWAVSYREVREQHSRDDVEELINVALDVIDQCAERWPGTQNSAQLYATFARACLQVYDARNDTPDESGSIYASPLLLDDGSPAPSESSTSTITPSNSSSYQQRQKPVFTQPQFGYVVDAPEEMNVFNLDPPPFAHPQFRSNSIFNNPSSEPTDGRRPSYGYFPPDFKHEAPEPSPTFQPTPQQAGISQQTHSPPPGQGLNQLPTPPESLIASSSANPSTLSPPMTVVSAPDGSPTPSMAFAASPVPSSMNQPPIPIPNLKYEAPSTPTSQPTPQQTPRQPPHGTPTFTVPPLPPHVAGGQRTQQRPLPQPTDWFSPPPPFISPLAFGSSNGGFWSDSAVSNAAFGGLNLGAGGGGGTAFGPNGQPNGMPGGGPTSAFGGGPGMPQYAFPPERQGSLSQNQQMELMEILETDGIGEINNVLGMDMNVAGFDGNIRWS